MASTGDEAIVTSPLDPSLHQHPNLLPVQLGQRVRLLDRGDPDWYLAKNTVTGSEGFLPATILNCSQQPPDDWYELNSDFMAQDSKQLTCFKGDKVRLVKKVNGDWWIIESSLRARGEVPAKQLDFSTPPPHQNDDDERRATPSNRKFKRAASKVLLRASSVKGLKGSDFKNSTSKLMDTLTPKRRASRAAAQNIPSSEPLEKPPSGWSFVRNKLGRESKRGRKPDKENCSPQIEPKEIPNKPPRRGKKSEDCKPDEPKPEPEQETGPRITPRSGDISLTDSYLWDPYTELHEDSYGPATRTTAEPAPSSDPATQPEIPARPDKPPLPSTLPPTLPPLLPPHLPPRPPVETESSEDPEPLERQNSTDTKTSVSDTFSEVFDLLPDPPAPGTFSPSRRSTLGPTSLLSPKTAGSTQTMVNVTPKGSTDDVPSTMSEETTRPLPRTALFRDNTDITPPRNANETSPGKRVRKCARAMSDVSMMSDMSSAVSEAPSFSGTKSGIHFFSAKEEPTSDVPDTPRINRILKNDPTFSNIVDESFFSPQQATDEVASEDIISIRSSDLDMILDDSALRKAEEEYKPVPDPPCSLVTISPLKETPRSTTDTTKSNPSQQDTVPAQAQGHTDPIPSQLSQGSHPKWDNVARKAREKLRAKKEDEERLRREKREDEERLRREDEKIKKRYGKNWFGTKGKKGEGSRESFVKKKEVDSGANTTVSSTNTLTSETTPPGTTVTTDPSMDTPGPSSATPDTSAAVVTLSEPPSRPPPPGNLIPLPPRKRKMQRQKTEQELPILPTSESRDTLSRDVPSTDHTTPSRDMLDGSYHSDTLTFVSALPSQEDSLPAVISFRRSSCDLTTTSRGDEEEADEDHVELLRRYHRLSASESEIFELLTPPKPEKRVDPLAVAEEEEGPVIRQVRSSSDTPGSSDTHVTQDTPTNEDDTPETSAESLVQLRNPPSTLLIPGSGEDSALDMSANNTLSFVYTVPPTPFRNTLTVTVAGGTSAVRVCQGPGGEEGREDGREEGAEPPLVESGEQHHLTTTSPRAPTHVETVTSPPAVASTSGGVKRRSRGGSGEEGTASSPPKAPRHAIHQSPTTAVAMSGDTSLPSHYEELIVGPPVVEDIRVVVESEDEEPPPVAAVEVMRRKKEVKIRKQHSVCDGKENLRVQGSPRRGRREEAEEDRGTGEVEVDSAIVPAEHSYVYPVSPGDNHLSGVKTPYHKANSYPPNYNSNILSLTVEQPPPSAPPEVEPTAPFFPREPSPRMGGQRYPHPSNDTVLYAEPTPSPSIRPPSLPAEYVSKVFGEDRSREQQYRPPQIPPPPRPAVEPVSSSIYPTLTSELARLPKGKKLSGISDNDETDPRTSTATPQRCSVQTRNVKINTDAVDFSAYSVDSKAHKSWLGRLKKSIIGRGQSKKKMKDPSLTQTRAEVTAAESTLLSSPVRSSGPPPPRPSAPPTTQPSAPPTAPEPSPEPDPMVEYEPETKPKTSPAAAPPSSIYPSLPQTTPPPPPLPPPTGLSPAHLAQPVFGTLPVPPNVPFMVYSFPYGVGRGPDQTGGLVHVGDGAGGLVHLQQQEQQLQRRREKRRKEGPHECIDPLLLSHDLIRHVKRSCGLNSMRSRTAARAIVQCLEDGIPESQKIHILSEVLSAMDSTFREHRTTTTETKRKRTRVVLNEGDVVKRHSCKRTLKEEKILMDYLQQTLEILEEMSESADKSNPEFHMYFNLANRLLETMFDKLARK